MGDTYDPFEELEAKSKKRRLESEFVTPTPFAIAPTPGMTPGVVPAPTPGTAAEAALRHPSMKWKEICSHYLNDDCRWGENCRFSHDVEGRLAGMPITTEIDFTNLDSGVVTEGFKIPRRQMQLMTELTRNLLSKASGDCGVGWDPEQSQAIVTGAPQLVERAGQLIKRLTTHCHWGISEVKVEGILNAAQSTKANLKLSPMATTLPKGSVCLTAAKPQFTIGSGPGNDLVIKGRLISRSHLVVEFTPEKGAVYVLDVSTNGTFLNGVRLPQKNSGKVFLSHGDELLFPEGSAEGATFEYGYMVNLELH